MVAGSMPPAPERILRQPAVDQDHRHAAPRRLDHDVRPQIRFHEQRQVGLPVIEEAAHEMRHVERHELMDDAARQPLLGEPARGDGAGGHQHADLARVDALDQRQHADQFADAGAMQPDQRAVRPRHGADAAPLAQAQRRALCRAAAAAPGTAASAASSPPKTAGRRATLPAAGRSRRRAPRAVGDLVGARGHAVELVLDTLAARLRAPRRRRRPARRSVRAATRPDAARTAG